MSASFEWQGDGLTALARELDTLPDRLMTEVIDPVMEEETSEAAHRMESRYAHESLRKGVRRDKRGPGDYRIRNTSQHAHLFDLGTVARFHVDGTPTGVMPATPVLIPEAIAARGRIGRGVDEGVTKLRTAHLEVTR
jgi:hypothetical protein